MARDVAQQLLLSPTPLPEHPLKNLCIPPLETLPQLQDHDLPHIFQLLEVYVNDFLGLIHAPTSHKWSTSHEQFSMPSI